MKGMMGEGTWEQTRPGDPRANAFLSCDAFSSQILLALPNNHYYMAPVDFADTVARYLGVPLPSIVEGGLEGLEMPCSVMRGEGRSRRRRRCDAHGHQMELANLPDNMLKVESEALEKAIHATLRYAGFDARWQDRLTFRTGTGERPPIVPDITSKLRVGEGPELTYLMDVKTVRLSGDTAGYSVRGSYDRPHGAMDVRGRQVPEEYLAKARRADAEAARGASQQNSGGGDWEEHEDWGAGGRAMDPAHRPGPTEKKLRGFPPPVGLCFGSYNEASQGVHDLAYIIAQKLAKDRGEELGVDKDRVLGIYTQRIRCEWGMAAARARARSREVRRPLVGCSREQAGRLLAGSCSAANPRRGPGDAHLEVLDAITWVEDTGARMSREARAEA